MAIENVSENVKTGERLTTVHCAQRTSLQTLQTLPPHTPPSHPSTLLHFRPFYDLGWLMLSCSSCNPVTRVAVAAAAAEPVTAMPSFACGEWRLLLCDVCVLHQLCRRVANDSSSVGMYVQS